MLKVMEFDSFEAYEASNVSSKYEVLAIVKRGNNQICADLMTNCKRYQTALRRFFKPLEGRDEFDGWQEALEECCENGTFQEYYDDLDYHWCVEACGDDCYYIELTVTVQANEVTAEPVQADVATAETAQADEVAAEPVQTDVATAETAQVNTVTAPAKPLGDSHPLVDGLTCDPLTRDEKGAILNRWKRLSTDSVLDCPTRDKAFHVWKFFEQMFASRHEDYFFTDTPGKMAPYLFGFSMNFRISDRFHWLTNCGLHSCTADSYSVRLLDRWMMTQRVNGSFSETFQDVYTRLIDADNHKNKIRAQKNPLDESTQAKQIASESAPVQADVAAAETAQADAVAAEPLDDSCTLVVATALPVIKPLAEKS